MQKELRIIIAGTRTFTDQQLLYSTLDPILTDYPEDKYKIVIVSGCAKGPDSMAIQYAKDHDYELKKFPAEWDKLGKSAGIRRNLQMAQYAADVHHTGLLVAFWDGNSPGTKNMIDVAQRYDIPTEIISIIPRVIEKVTEEATDT